MAFPAQTAAVELYPGQHAEHEKQMKIIAMQTTILTRECCTILHHVSDALNAPGISRRDIEEVMRAATRAYAAAVVLDPPEDQEL